MKRFLCILLALTLVGSLLLFGGCGKKTNDPASDAAKTADEPQGPPTDDDFDIQVVESDDGYAVRKVLIITNNYPSTVGIEASGVAKDASGAELDTSDDEIRALAPGRTGMISLYFTGGVSDAEITYEMEYNAEPEYEDATPNLTYTDKVEKDGNKATVTVDVTNNGDAPAEFVTAHLVLFDADGALMTMTDNQVYTKANDYKIQPGETVSNSIEITVYSDFDHYDLYLEGVVSE